MKIQIAQIFVLILGFTILIVRMPSLPPNTKTVWEYDSVLCNDQNPPAISDNQFSKSFSLINEEIKAKGRDGWELCAICPETETVYPKLIETPTDIIEPNVRTKSVELIFKRSHQEIER